MMEFRIVPVAKPRMSRRDVWAKRAIVNKYYAFKDELIKQAKDKKFKLPDKYRVEFLMPMPASWSLNKKIKMVGTPHKCRPDLDNLLKAINDCLLPKEDSMVWSVEAAKLWWDEGKIIFYKK